MITIGITGTIGAGKGTIVDYLVKEKGFAHFQARGFILKEVDRRGLERVRDNINAVGNDLRKQHGPDYIIRELLKEAQGKKQNAVIESIRAFGEIDCLRKNAENFYLFAVDADLKTRYERIIDRGSSTDHVSFEKFVEDETKEFDAKEVWNMNLKGCIAQADFVFENNGSFDELQEKIDEVLKKILK
jgi:dephospho-CoA kinase